MNKKVTYYTDEILLKDLNTLNNDELKLRYIYLKNSTFNSYKYKNELEKLLNYLYKNNINIFD